MPFIARHNDRDASFHRQLQQRLIVWIAQVWNPIRFELPFFSRHAQRVESIINVCKRESHLDGASLRDFLVFEKQVIAQNDLPASTAKFGENFKGRAMPRPKCTQKNIGVDNGARRHGGWLGCSSWRVNSLGVSAVQFSSGLA